MGLLDGQVVLVTGGARGQGRAHALASAKEGADVAIVDRVADLSSVPYPLATEDELKATAADIEALGRRALTFVGDVRSSETLDHVVSTTIDSLGRIDAVDANAGIWATATLWELSEDDWQETLDINLTGVWRTIKAVAPHMIARGSGSIVVTASVDAVESGGSYAHYIASKHGVLGLMKAAALELAPHGVRCNAIAPGAVDTKMLDNQPGYDLIAGHPGGTRADLLEGGYHYGALRGTTLLDPQHIADAALFLHSHLASKITGVMLPVDAGHMLITGYNHAPVR